MTTPIHRARAKYDARHAWLRVRISQDERAAIRRICAERGWTLRQFVRAAITATGKF